MIYTYIDVLPQARLNMKLSLIRSAQRKAHVLIHALYVQYQYIKSEREQKNEQQSDVLQQAHHRKIQSVCVTERERERERI